MTRRDPHDVLGVPRGASQTAIKAAWRKLAREHHPDVARGDAVAARRATRQMVEINAAYEELRTGNGSVGADGKSSRNGAAAAGGGPAASGGSRRTYRPAGQTERTKAHAPGGAPRPRPGRPVTGRLDFSDTFRPPRNEPSTPGRVNPLGKPPKGAWRGSPEPLRASDPTGPLERSRIRRFRPPARPSLQDARATQIEFGKFHGHTLGEIAAFEPSYIDWVASTITRDRDLVAAARVLQEDLDERGVVRVRRAERIRRPGQLE